LDLALASLNLTKCSQKTKIWTLKYFYYPTSAENKHFSVKNPNTLQYIENLKIQLAKNNIKKFMEILKIFILSKNTFMTRLI